jgi:hypothetical protein
LLEAADQNVRQVDVIGLDVLVLQGLDPDKLDRLERVPARHIAKQRCQSSQGMDIHRQRRELSLAGARATST